MWAAITADPNASPGRGPGAYQPASSAPGISIWPSGSRATGTAGASTPRSAIRSRTGTPGRGSGAAPGGRSAAGRAVVDSGADAGIDVVDAVTAGPTRSTRPS